MQTLKEGVDWNYVVPEDEGTTVGIKLLSGKFKDIVYQYGKVGFDEQENGDTYLRFVYNLIESPFEKDYIDGNMDFKNHIGDILVNIISQQMEKGLIDEVGTDYSEESDS